MKVFVIKLNRVFELEVLTKDGECAHYKLDLGERWLIQTVAV